MDFSQTYDCQHPLQATGAALKLLMYQLYHAQKIVILIKVSKMTQQGGTSSIKPSNLSPIHGTTWWMERMDPCDMWTHTHTNK